LPEGIVRAFCRVASGAAGQAAYASKLRLQHTRG
jgi:hypothetical protein